MPVDNIRLDAKRNGRRDVVDYGTRTALVPVTGGASSSSLPLQLGVTLLLVPIALLGPNTALAMLAWLVLVAGIQLLWRPGEPPILLLIFVYQWIQAAIELFYGNLLGYGADHFTEHGGQHDRAIMLTLIGLFVLSFALRVAIGRQNSDLSRQLRERINRLPVRTWFAMYAGTWLFGQVCLLAAPLSAGLYQPLLFLSQFKWAAFFALTVATFGHRGTSWQYWGLAFALEFAQSVGGYFSSFSDVFLYTLIGMAAANVKIKLRSAVPVALAAGLLVVVGIVWSGVKKDYRDFVSQGRADQTVRIGTVERLTELGRLVGEMDADRFAESSDIMAQRLMYFEFFGVVLDRVPAGTNYSGGEIWGTAVWLPLTPRLFFPNKMVINDTTLTEKYTGLHVNAWKGGASISIGYMAEAYIDFGPVLMFAAIGALGIYMGLLYRWLLRQEGAKLVLGAALAPVALMPAHALESSSLKVVPPLVLSLIGCWFILRVVSGRFEKLFEQSRERRRTGGRHSVAFG